MLKVLEAKAEKASVTSCLSRLCKCPGNSYVAATTAAFPVAADFLDTPGVGRPENHDIEKGGLWLWIECVRQGELLINLHGTELKNLLTLLLVLLAGGQVASLCLLT